MTVSLPDTVSVLGTRSVWVVPKAAAADADEITLADLTAGVKATCYTYGNAALVSGEQTYGDAPRKTCEVTARQKIGPVSETFNPIQYSYSPQVADSDDANALKAAMPMGSVVYVVERLGVVDATTPTTSHYFNVYEVELGYPNRTQTGDDDQAEYSITQGGSLLAASYDLQFAAS